MFCNQCGNEIPDGSKFCHICGAKMIVPQEIVQEVQPIQPSYEQEIQRNYAQSDYSQTNYTQTDYTQIYDGYNGQQYTDNTQPAYVSNTVIPTATEKKVNKPASGKKKGLIIGGSIAATLIAAVAIVLIVLAPFKKKDKETSQLPFGKITYGMTRNEGIERYGEPYYTYDHGDYLYDCYGYEFMGVKGTFLISYLDNEFTDSWWESIDITSYVDENQRYDYDYNTYNELKSKQTDIEKLFDEFIGESGKIDFSEGGYIGKIWRNQSDEQAVRNEIKAYVSTIELYTDSGDGEFSISFYYADYNALAREDSNDQYYTTEAVIEETAEATTEATTEAATEEEINNSVIYIYGSNNDLENVLQGFYNKYPEYRDRVVYKSLDVAYYDLEEYLNPEFNSSEVPSIVIYD
ncbi:MAG: zinc ribbon domain-containing protein, partial [Lachnospiraceae bacterium]|nr:zinc ribbon domain-containing protein [Lachnospiraceae bacterium]